MWNNYRYLFQENQGAVNMYLVSAFLALVNRVEAPKTIYTEKIVKVCHDSNFLAFKLVFELRNKQMKEQNENSPTEQTPNHHSGLRQGLWAPSLGTVWLCKPFLLASPWQRWPAGRQLLAAAGTLHPSFGSDLSKGRSVQSHCKETDFLNEVS